MSLLVNCNKFDWLVNPWEPKDLDQERDTRWIHFDWRKGRMEESGLLASSVGKVTAQSRDTGHSGQDTRGFHLCLNFGAKLLNLQLMKEGPHALSITGCFLDIKVSCSGDWWPARDSWQSQCLMMQSGLSGTSTANAHVTLRLSPCGSALLMCPE